MFSAYTQEDNKFIIFSLFYLHFCFGPQVCVGNSSLGIFGVVPWRGSVRNITLLAHTSYFHHFSRKTFHLTPFAVYTRHFVCVTVTDRDRPTFAGCHSCLWVRINSYHTCIHSGDMVCKFWCQKVLCFLAMYCRKMTLPLNKTITLSTARCSERL
jgi:hypothetical protein